jgi:hypothetical protein
MNPTISSKIQKTIKRRATSGAASPSSKQLRLTESSITSPRSAPSLNPRCGVADISAIVEGDQSALESSKQLRLTESSITSPRSAPSLNPRCGVADISAIVEGDQSALEIRNTRAQETDLCVFCDPSTCEQANLGRKDPKTFRRNFSGLMRCRSCGLSVCNLCVRILLQRMGEIPGCDPDTWDNANTFLEAVSNAVCSPQSILCCVTPIGHCCEHKNEINAVVEERKKVFDEMVSNMSAASAASTRVVFLLTRCGHSLSYCFNTES